MLWGCRRSGSGEPRGTGDQREIDPGGKPVIDDATLDRVMAQVETEGLELLGPDGVLTDLTSRIMNRALAVEMSDLVICVSRHTRAAVLRWATIAPERVIVLPNTVGEAFTPGDGLALRAEVGLTGKQLLLTVARMVSMERRKGNGRAM